MYQKTRSHYKGTQLAGGEPFLLAGIEPFLDNVDFACWSMMDDPPKQRMNGSLVWQQEQSRLWRAISFGEQVVLFHLVCNVLNTNLF